MDFDPQHVENILAVYSGASGDIMRSGISWYPRAHAFAATLDDDVTRACAIVAVLSPNTSWAANKTLALKAYAQQSGDGMGFDDKVTKVNRLFAGETPDKVVKGPKVTVFYRSMLNPHDTTIPAVIDRHAQDVADGFRNKNRKAPRAGRQYNAYAAAYSEAARILGIPVQWLQAITWETWKEAHSINV